MRQSDSSSATRGRKLVTFLLAGIALSAAPAASAFVWPWEEEFYRCASPAGASCNFLAGCCGELVCDISIGKCRHNPPRLNEPCSIFSGCQDPTHNYCKGFQDGLAGACVPFRKTGDSCIPLYEMCGNISNANRTCSVIPRDVVNPMPFENELVCYPGPLTFDPLDDEECRDQWSRARHLSVVLGGKARTYGNGWGAAAIWAATTEVGVVYGADGRFGCYRENCQGGQSSVGAYNYVVAGEFGSFDDFKAATYAHAKGASVVAGYSVGWAYRSVDDFDPDDETLNALGSLAASSIGVDVMFPFGAYEFLTCTSEMPREYWWDGVSDSLGSFRLQCLDAVAYADPGTCTAEASVSKDPGNEGVAVVQDPPGPFGIGSFPVTLRPQDPGAALSCDAIVEVLDNAEPEILHCPSALIAECETNGTATVVAADFDAPVVTDCSPYVVHPPEDEVFALGTTAVHFAAQDSSGNAARCNTSVTVIDTIPPVIGASTPPVFAAECTSPLGTAVAPHASFDDACDPAPAITFSPKGPYPLGTTIVAFTAKDASGNEGAGSTMVTILDTTAPAIASVRPSLDVLWPPNHELVPVHVAIDATDTCDTAPACRIVGVDFVESSRVAARAAGTSSSAASSLGTPWEMRGDLDVALRAERAGTSTGRTYTITVRCTDASGNPATSQAQVTVPHDAS